MPILLLGQNHRTAPIELREQLAFDDAKFESLVSLVQQNEVFTETVVVNTCNRAEIYAVGEDTAAAQARLGQFLEQVHGLPLDRFSSALYRCEESHAVRHLFRVASGLDSMVLGEGQILSQVKQGYAAAREVGVTQEILHRVFNHATACGKKVRTDTRIGEGAVSVAFAAVELAKKIFRDLREERVLLIGAGATGRKVAHHLQVFGVQDILVTNRTQERGHALAEELGASLVPWGNFSSYLHDTAIVVTAASVQKPLFDRELARAALDGRGRRPLFLIDLGVPRNIDPDVGRLPGVFLYNVDHLEGVVEESSKRRRGEAEKAEEIVDGEVCRFLEWYNARSMTPTVVQLRAHIETIRQNELDAVRGRLDEATLDEMDKVTRRIVNKILHTPTVQLKSRASGSEASSLVRQVRELFGLDDKPVL